MDGKGDENGDGEEYDRRGGKVIETERRGKRDRRGERNLLREEREIG